MCQFKSRTNITCCDIILYTGVEITSRLMLEQGELQSTVVTIYRVSLSLWAQVIHKSNLSQALFYSFPCMLLCSEGSFTLKFRASFFTDFPGFRIFAVCVDVNQQIGKCKMNQSVRYGIKLRLLDRSHYLHQHWWATRGKPVCCMNADIMCVCACV